MEPAPIRRVSFRGFHPISIYLLCHCRGMELTVRSGQAPRGKRVEDGHLDRRGHSVLPVGGGKHSSVARLVLGSGIFVIIR